VAGSWPAFAARGKAAITVRQVLAHTAGIPQLPPGARVAALGDWDGRCRRVAALAPLWPPGRRTGDHARTFGYVLGEVVRRVDGRPVDRFVREEVCRPLGMDDLYFGLPDAAAPRAAVLEQLEVPPPAPPGSLAALAIPPAIPATAAVFNRPDVRRACLPSSAGVASARALARHDAALVGAGVGGVRLLSPARVGLATALQTDAVDAVLGAPVPKALGYVLGAPGSALGARRAAFGHGGTGGSVGFADPEYGLAFALTKTRLVATSPGAGVEGAAVRVARDVRSALGIPDR
jgi:CubicO group peptidase (beta-lactamase class C family)